MAREIYVEYFEGYRLIDLIENGTYPIEDCREHAQFWGNEWGLKPKVIPGSLSMLDRLSRCEWGEDFFIFRPGQLLNGQMLGKA